MTDNSEFEKFLHQLHRNSGGSYNPYNAGAARNQAIDDLIKSLTEQVDKYCDEVDQRRNGKHKPKFTDEEFNKTCEELGLVEDK